MYQVATQVRLQPAGVAASAEDDEVCSARVSRWTAARLVDLDAHSPRTRWVKRQTQRETGYVGVVGVVEVVAVFASNARADKTTDSMYSAKDGQLDGAWSSERPSKMALRRPVFAG